jgi:hypothetical protein
MSYISNSDYDLYFWYIYLLFIGSKITPVSSKPLTKIFTAYWLINNLDCNINEDPAEIITNLEK